MADAVITFNQDRTILLSNPPAEKFLQQWRLGTGEQTGEPLPPEIGHMLDHVLSFEEEVEEELEMGGNYYAVSISPLYSKASIRGAVAVLYNLTEQHKLENCGKTSSRTSPMSCVHQSRCCKDTVKRFSTTWSRPKRNVMK